MQHRYRVWFPFLLAFMMCTLRAELSVVEFPYMFESVSESAGTVTVDIVISPPPTEPSEAWVILEVSSDVTNGEDLVFTNPNVISLAAGVGTQSFQFVVLDDTVPEIDEQVMIAIERVGPGCVTGVLGEHVVRILDNDSCQPQLNLPATSFCSDGAPVTLEGSPSGGTYSGPGVSGNQFHPSVAGEGSHTLFYTVDDPSTCTNLVSVTAQVVSCCDNDLSTLQFNSPALQVQNIDLWTVETATGHSDLYDSALGTPSGHHLEMRAADGSILMHSIP